MRERNTRWQTQGARTRAGNQELWVSAGFATKILTIVSVAAAAEGSGTQMADCGESQFFSCVEDHLLAMLFAHLPGSDVARLAGVCRRWREVVQGDGSDENIWRSLWFRDFRPYAQEADAAARWPSAPSIRHIYAWESRVDNLLRPLWTPVHPSNGPKTVMDRQGAAGAVFNGAQFACCTSTPVQRLTQKALLY
jgi:hypothetical protein